MTPASSHPLREVAGAFLRLGCIAFGGPVAHLGYFRAEFVARRRWLDDAHFGDLVALCQFLPGPASSQLVFAMGMHRAGLAGAVLASACFTLPSAALMIAFAYGVARVGDLRDAGWLHGLKLAAVAVVAQAVWAMGKKLCTDRARVSLCVASAAALLTVPGAAVQVAVIALGASQATRCTATRSLRAACRLRSLRRVAIAPPQGRSCCLLDCCLRSLRSHRPRGHASSPPSTASTARALWCLAGATSCCLCCAPKWCRAAGSPTIDSLRATAPRRALPGPLFTFAAYLGAAMDGVGPRWLWGLVSLMGVFAPAWLLIGGALPFWHSLRTRRWAQAALAGANASVVGVLLAALYRPVITEGVRGPRDVAAALVAFVVLEHWKAPPWAVVMAMGALGQWVLAR